MAHHSDQSSHSPHLFKGFHCTPVAALWGTAPNNPCPYIKSNIWLHLQPLSGFSLTPGAGHSLPCHATVSKCCPFKSCVHTARPAYLNVLCKGLSRIFECFCESVFVCPHICVHDTACMWRSKGNPRCCLLSPCLRLVTCLLLWTAGWLVYASGEPPASSWEPESNRCTHTPPPPPAPASDTPPPISSAFQLGAGPLSSGPCTLIECTLPPDWVDFVRYLGVEV